MCERGYTQEVIIGGKSISIDSCIAGVVASINKDGRFRTLGSCCGHGSYRPTIIVRSEECPFKELWSLARREQFLQYTEYPGLPDCVYTQREEHGQLRTYAVEIETNLTLKTFDKKQMQFKRFGVNEVYIKDLKKCPDRTNWVKVQNYLMDGLP